MKSILLLTATLFSFGSVAADYQGKTDSDLSVQVLELRGAKATTNNNLYVKSIIKRNNASFEAFCYRSGEVSKVKFINMLGCSIVAETVSQDDDEMLSFEIAWEQSPNKHEIRIQNVDYMGDGTILGDNVKTLTGFKHDSNKIRGLNIELTAVTRVVDTSFTKVALLRDAVETLIGQRATIKDGRI